MMSLSEFQQWYMENLVGKDPGNIVIGIESKLREECTKAETGAEEAPAKGKRGFLGRGRLEGDAEA